MVFGWYHRLPPSQLYTRTLYISFILLMLFRQTFFTIQEAIGKALNDSRREESTRQKKPDPISLELHMSNHRMQCLSEKLQTSEKVAGILTPLDGTSNCCIIL